MGKLLRFLAVILAGSIVTTVSAVFLAPQVGSIVTANDVAEISDIELRKLDQRSTVLAADGTEYAVLHGDQNRESIPLEEIPEVLIDTVLAIEDEHFFEHDGVNLKATVRALLTNVSSGDVMQGGSTITQQLVKNSTDVGFEQTMDRKVKEAVLAVRLEDQLSKQEILERYLNTVYLGNTAYGVQAAAETYFGKDAKDLDRGDAAFLAGLIQNPVELDPFRRPELVIERREEVVNRLLAIGRITDDEATWIKALPIPTASKMPPVPEDPFIQVVRNQLLADERLGATPKEREDAVYRGGLTIETTIDKRLQDIATVAAINEHPAPERGLAVAIASVEPSTGAVRALGGEARRGERKLELHTGSGRQPGSTFKPFVLAAYLEDGGSPNDTVSGSAPCVFPNPGGTPNPYSGGNYGDSTGGGMMDLRRAVTTSNNCAFLNLGDIVGLEKVIEVARRFGFPMETANSITTPLGTTNANPVQQAAAYATFANNGVYNPPYFIERVTKRDGTVILAHEPTPTTAVSPETAAIVTNLLAANATSGTGTRAQFPDRRPIAGKTGTTQNVWDVWFAGFIPQMATAVWMGDPVMPTPIQRINGSNVTGGLFAAPIWGAYMSAAFGEVPAVPFPGMPPVRPGTPAMSPADRLGWAMRQAEERERAARRAEEERRSPTVPDRPSPTRPSPTPTTPPEPTRPDRNPDDGFTILPPGLRPPGDGR